MLFEPPRSQYDLHFRIFDFPVRVHPLFWLIAVLLGISGGTQGTPPVKLFIWVVAMFISIVVHELGHTFMQRRHGGRPRIVLHSFGGLAISEGEDQSPRSQIEIALAGPMAGFLLAIVAFLLIRLSGHMVGWKTGEWTAENIGLPAAMGFPMLFGNFYWEPYTSAAANYMVSSFMQINILWGVLNLLPLYPLDGGRVARELLSIQQPYRGIVLSLQLSMITGGIVAVVGLLNGSLFMAFMFGYLAYMNYRAYQSYSSSRW